MSAIHLNVVCGAEMGWEKTKSKWQLQMDNKSQTENKRELERQREADGELRNGAREREREIMELGVLWCCRLLAEISQPIEAQHLKKWEEHKSIHKVSSSNKGKGVESCSAFCLLHPLIHPHNNFDSSLTNIYTHAGRWIESFYIFN